MYPQLQTQEGFNPHHQILTDVDHFAENNADGLRFSIAQDELGTCKGKLPAIVNEVMSLPIHTNEVMFICLFVCLFVCIRFFFF
jgi:hypothetical protein